MGAVRQSPSGVDDLLAFAESEKIPAGPGCPICALPERDVIDEAKRRAKPRSVGGVMVRRWLISRHGYTEETVPNRQSFEHHFNQRHHELPAK